MMINSDTDNVSSLGMELDVDMNMIDPILFQSSIDEPCSSSFILRENSFQRRHDSLSTSITTYSELSSDTSGISQQPSFTYVRSQETHDSNISFLMDYSAEQQQPKSNPGYFQEFSTTMNHILQLRSAVRSENSSKNQFDIPSTPISSTTCSKIKTLNNNSNHHDISEFLNFDECENSVSKSVKSFYDIVDKQNSYLSSSFQPQKFNQNKRKILNEKNEIASNPRKKIKSNDKCKKKLIQNNDDKNLGGSLIGISQFTKIDNKRYNFIIKQSLDKNLNLNEVENILSLLTIKKSNNNSAIHVTKLQFNLNFKLEILYLLSQCIPKTDTKEEMENNKNVQCYSKLVDRFPLFETNEGLFFKVRSSCVSSDANALITNQYQHVSSSCIIKAKWLHTLNQFKIFRRVMDDDELRNKRKRKHQQEIENYIKRPSNSFMLYRNSILKSLIILIILNLLDELIFKYHSLIFSLESILDEEINSDLEYSILQLIKIDILKQGKQQKSQKEYYENICRETLECIYFNNYESSNVLSFKSFKLNFENSESDRENILFKFQSSINNENNNSKSINLKLSYNYALVCHLISFLWISETDQIKQNFKQFSEIEKKIHKDQFPNYKFNPRKNRAKSFS